MRALRQSLMIQTLHNHNSLNLDRSPTKLKRAHYKIHAGSYCLDLGRQTKIMGIINMTPDSFSRDGHLTKGHTLEQTVRTVKELISQGADIIDIGGESTRPGAHRISAQEETERVIPIIQSLTKTINVPISVDTYKSSVAKQALDAGATMINNIMGIKPDPTLLKMVRNYNAGIILMHIQGTPRTMQRNVHYQNLIEEITESLKNSIENCLEIGIKSDKIIIDPGIGFGKDLDHNLEILNRLSEFAVLNKPLLIGTSRKSFIGKVLNKEVQDRLMGTAATVCASTLNGAHIIRAHDVAAMKDIVMMTDAIINVN